MIVPNSLDLKAQGLVNTARLLSQALTSAGMNGADVSVTRSADLVEGERPYLNMIAGGNQLRSVRETSVSLRERCVRFAGFAQRRGAADVVANLEATARAASELETAVSARVW